MTKKRPKQAGVMATVKGFWRHVNGKIYAVESDTFGKIIGGVGPDNLRDPEDYVHKAAIVNWLQEAFAQRKQRRINPPRR